MHRFVWAAMCATSAMLVFLACKNDDNATDASSGDAGTEPLGEAGALCGEIAVSPLACVSGYSCIPMRCSCPHEPSYCVRKVVVEPGGDCDEFTYGPRDDSTYHVCPAPQVCHETTLGIGSCAPDAGAGGM